MAGERHQGLRTLISDVALLAERLLEMERLASEIPGFDTCEVIRVSIHPLLIPAAQLARKVR